MDKKKALLIDAIVKLGCAQADSILEKEHTNGETPEVEFQQVETQQTGGAEEPVMIPTPPVCIPEVQMSDLESTWNLMHSWSDGGDSKVRAGVA